MAYGPGSDGSGECGTAVGEWICDELWPAVTRGIGYCLGKMLLGLLFGLGFWLASWVIRVIVVPGLVYLTW
jgi:hypothetical protein